MTLAEQQNLSQPSAWLLMAVGDDRQHGCNDGYEDDPNYSYTWDETVPNHANLRVGDRPDAQLSMRGLDWDALVEALRDHPRSAEVNDWTSRRQVRLNGGGHQMRMTRVRLGQAAFRARILARYGYVCAISGAAPPEVLDAAHLYSYADVGTH